MQIEFEARLPGRVNATSVQLPDKQVLAFFASDHVNLQCPDVSDTVGIIESMQVGNGVVHGTMKVLETPKGRLLRDLLEQPMQFSYGARGLAKIDSQGVVSEFKVDSISVIDPT